MLTSIDWLSKQLEALPPSHSLRHLVFDFQEPLMIFPDPWSRLDEIIKTRQNFQVKINLSEWVDVAQRRRVASSAFPLSDRAGLVSSGIRAQG